MKARQLFISLILGLGLTLALLCLLGGSTLSAHAESPHYVAHDCTGVPVPCHTSIQEAVDAAVPGDEILVAAGTYTGVNVRPRDDITTTGVVTQVVYVSKTVTIRGGYNADFSAWDPDTYSTMLDAQGQGRVLYVTGDISPTLEGLRIAGGNADDLGGGVYVISATATISNNQVFSSTASGGGGLLLGYSDATLSGNTVFSNTAGSGGGLLLAYSDATLSGNTVTSNTAIYGGYGGGLLLESSDATLSANTVASNISGHVGGGLFLSYSAATLSGNIVISNTASHEGGGLLLTGSAATLSGNTINDNTADGGGGLWLDRSAATLNGNTISGNTAGGGGGLLLWSSDATLSGNTVTSNTAYYGGGLYLYDSDAMLTNNVVADNQADTAGGGLYIAGSSPRLLHTTIVRNGSTELTASSGGSGVHVTSGSTVALTNTILVSHTVGITVTGGNRATLEATLWGSGDWANDTDWGGAGTIITGTRNYWGDPAFVAPDTGDYHIGLTSAAIDKGVDAGVDEDIDSDPRPMGHGYDLGADELRIALTVTKQATPDPVQAGAPLTYTIHVANTGKMTLTATITDTLPEHVTTMQPLVWASQVIPAPGGVWAETVVVTVEVGYIGPLTNLVQVTTEEGATGVYTETSASGYEICLPLIMRQYP